MKAGILCVGTELLMGDTVNTNGAYLGRFLTQLQIHILHIDTVGDNRERIAAAVRRLAESCDLIITTGGLGPTVDDITKEVVCEVFGYSTEINAAALVAMHDKMGAKATINNLKQAMFPHEATILPNDLGTAAGMYLKTDRVIAVCLPGPPLELSVMTDKYLMPLLGKQQSTKLFSKYLHIYGIGESALEEKIKDVLARQTTTKIGTYFDGDKVTLRLSSSDPNRRRAYVEKTEMAIRKLLPDQIITEDSETIEDFILSKLKRQQLTVTTAESCTGGELSAALTRVSGASEVFDRAFITYSNEAKTKLLGIDDSTIRYHGAVSAEVAKAMAKGAKRAAMADISVAITGIAGPKVPDEATGTKKDVGKKRVGLVYIAVAYGEQVACQEFYFDGSRRRVRRASVYHAFLMLNRAIDELLTVRRRNKEAKQKKLAQRAESSIFATKPSNKNEQNQTKSEKD
ncbi:MAG: competence/damage-inducible protein A [Bacillota bacterium]|nr:competence/damage-inducible protein A [Bacillota bacterium]